MLVLLVGIAALVALGWTRPNRVESVSVALFIGGAALTSGAVFGFLFGIPRANQEEKTTGLAGEFRDRLYQVNTNLEQISDWLTKIIVGVGLVELVKIPPKFIKLADYAASGFGNPIVPSALVAVVLMYFATTGFLGAYLWTRLFLTLEFTRADRAARQSPAFYEGLVQALLYEPAPEGYQGAIENAEEFMRRFGQGNWRIWRSVACAYGQKYGYLLLQETPDKKEQSQTRDKALEAVKRVLYLNPGEREGIRALWERDRTTPQEDDLTSFEDDDDFRRLLVPAGEPPSPNTATPKDPQSS